MADDGWEPVTDPIVIKKVLGTAGMNKVIGGGGGMMGSRGTSKLSNPDSTFLNGLRAQSQSGLDSLTQYRQAAAAAARLGTGPGRASWLEARIPSEGGGFFDKLGAMTLGSLPFVAPSQQEVDDFQRLKGLQSGRVLEQQIAQKGPQTESDAARMQLTEVSPYKSQAVNADVIRTGALKAALAAQKAPFYTKWAATHGGLNSLDDRGRTADEVWDQIVSGAQARSEARMTGAQKGRLKFNAATGQIE